MIGLIISSLASAVSIRSLAGSYQQAAILSRDDAHSHSFVKKLEFNHRLRVCNAYPYGAALDVFRAQEKLTDEPMKYKDCREFNIKLLMGDKLLFKVGEQNVGTFSVATMPENDAILLLVISRHDTLSTAVKFDSHVFANLLNAQLATIDTYKGAKKSNLKIEDVSENADETKLAQRSEDLRMDSVVAINPGVYNAVIYGGKDGRSKQKVTFTAHNREAYTVLRVGVEAQKGSSYPEEIIVFPQSSLSAACSLTSVTLLMFAIFLW